MSLAHIILIAGAVLLVLFVIGTMVYANTRPIPEGGKRKLTKYTDFFVNSKRFVFGSRGAAHYDDIGDAMFSSPHKWLVDIFLVLVVVIVVLYMNADLNLISWGNNGLQFNIGLAASTQSIGSDISRLFKIDPAYFFGYGEYKFTEGVIYQLFQTFAIAYVGTLIAAIIGIPFGLLASHHLFHKGAYVSEIILILIRTLPEILLALLMVNFTGMNALTGVLALSIHSIGMIGKLYAEEIDELDVQPMEAISASGGNLMQRIHLGIMPNFRPALLSVALYRFDINLRTTTIIGVVVGGGCGIGFSLRTDASINNWSRLGADVLGVVIFIVLLDVLSSWLRKKLV